MHTITSTWPGLLGHFFPVFTKPGAKIFGDLITGWVLCTARRTITGILPFADPMNIRAHDAYHRFFSISGNILMTGATIAVESNAYIESLNDIQALEIIGDSQIGGDVSICNSLAVVDLQGGQAGIGGETGQTAIDEHVE